MSKAIGALIGALFFGLFTLWSVSFVEMMLCDSYPLLIGWSLIGALTGYVFAMEKQSIFKKKAPVFGACLMALLNLSIALFLFIIKSAGGWIVFSFISNPFFGFTELSLYNPSFIYLFFLTGMLIWGAIGAAIGSIIQNMHEGEW